MWTSTVTSEFIVWLSGCSEAGPDPDPELMEPIQPSVSISPHGRFERLQEDPNYISHFTRAPVHKGQRRLHCFLLRWKEKKKHAGRPVWSFGGVKTRFSFGLLRGTKGYCWPVNADITCHPSSRRYTSAGLGLFSLGMLIGWFFCTPAHTEPPDPPSDSSDLLEELLQQISAEKINALHK